MQLFYDACSICILLSVVEKSSDIPGEITSGVLTLPMPPTKQTPNRQIWWSSPISRPRRYEYDADEEVWARDVGTDLNEDDDEYGDSRTLGGALAAEVKTLYGWDVDLDL